MNIIVKQYNVKREDGYHNRISLVDENSLPVSPYTVIFLNSWIPQKSISNKKRKSNELKFFLQHLKNVQPDDLKAPIGIDIIQRALSGQFLSKSECRSFTDACRFKVKKDNNSNVLSMEKFNDKTLQNAIHSSKVSREIIDDGTKHGRIKTALSFLEFLYEEIHGQFLAPDFVKNNYFSVKHELELAIANKIKKTEAPSFAESKIPPHIYLRLLEIIQIDSPDNPFKHAKQRNSLIVQLILETGERRGAISKLKISDCQFEGTGDQIRITKTPNDLTDPRINPSSQKTDAHSAYVDPNIMTDLDKYIEYQRKRFTKSELHEFIFIAEHDSKGTKGEPLNVKGINGIFTILSKALGFHITPHLGRHKWNEIFSDLTKDMSDEQADKLRKYAMGWSKTSGMVDVYNKFKHSVEVREIQRARQAKIMSAGVNDGE